MIAAVALAECQAVVVGIKELRESLEPLLDELAGSPSGLLGSSNVDSRDFPNTRRVHLGG
jgi:hypothetical protein